MQTLPSLQVAMKANHKLKEEYPKTTKPHVSTREMGFYYSGHVTLD